jgi:OmpA-OmpF porin, OOP family
MKKNVLILALLIATISPLFAQKMTTLAPKVNQQSQKYIEITKVALTDKYTIVYFYLDNRPTSFEDLIQGKGQPNLIEIDPRVKLIDIRDESQTFKFVKAEGITIAPQQQRLESGDVVEFAVYFERLKPGVEIFDLYEGKDYKNKTDNRHFWNFYAIQNLLHKHQLPSQLSPL